MDIPQELRDRVLITDHGVVEQVDPETGDMLRYYATTYTVENGGVEYGLTLSSSPTEERQDVYEKLLEMGTYGVLAKAGLLP